MTDTTTARRLQALAIACLALAIAAIGAALYASTRAAGVQGPGALVVTAADEAWLGIDDELWRLAADGTTLGHQPFATLGLPGPPAGWQRLASGRIVATVRDDPGLYWIDPATRRVERRVQPRWPADLERHAARATTAAVHDDGRIAIATGGGHAVALFAADGAFIARTAPGTYRFTNGLWWLGDELWTTDTNRFVLRRLDGRTLASRGDIPLAAARAERFLGPARLHPGAGNGSAPLAALVRLQGDMTAGGISAIDTDGRERLFAMEAAFEPRDLDWLRGALIATDGRRQAVRRWAADGSAQPDFGDAVLQRRLAEGVSSRHAWRRLYALGLGAAALCFGIGLALAVRAQRLGHDAPRLPIADPPAPGPVRRPRRAATLASLLVPGLGQWWQRRRHVALLMFLGWSLVLVFMALPVMWALMGPRTEVRIQQVVVPLLLLMGAALLSALDAWQHGD